MIVPPVFTPPVTVSATAFEVIPPLKAVTLEFPATTPVTTPALETLALVVSLELKVNAGCGVNAVPLESLPMAAQVLVAAIAMLAGVQVSKMLESVGFVGGVVVVSGQLTSAAIRNGTASKSFFMTSFLSKFLEIRKFKNRA